MTQEAFTALVNIDVNSSKMQELAKTLELVIKKTQNLAQELRAVEQVLGKQSRFSSARLPGTAGREMRTGMTTLAEGMEAGRPGASGLVDLQGQALKMKAEGIKEKKPQLEAIGEYSTQKLRAITKEAERLQKQLDKTTAAMNRLSGREGGGGGGWGGGGRGGGGGGGGRGAGGMVFMADASPGVARAMRMMSSAAQGSMLAFSALNGQIQGVLFSLLFFHFAGQLKVAGAFILLGAAAIGAMRLMKGFLDQRKETAQFNREMFIWTKNTQANVLVTQRSEKVTHDLGIATKHQKDFVKGLNAAQLELAKQGLLASKDNMVAFISAYAIAKSSGEKNSAAITAGISAMNSSIDGSLITVGKFQGGLDELSSHGATAMLELQGGFNQMSEEFIIDAQALWDAVTTLPPPSDMPFEAWQKELASIMQTGLGHVSVEGGKLLGLSDADFKAMRANLEEQFVGAINLEDFVVPAVDPFGSLRVQMEEISAVVGTHFGPDGKLDRAIATIDQKFKELSNPGSGMDIYESAIQSLIGEAETLAKRIGVELPHSIKQFADELRTFEDRYIDDTATKGGGTGTTFIPKTLQDISEGTLTGSYTPSTIQAQSYREPTSITINVDARNANVVDGTELGFRIGMEATHILDGATGGTGVTLGAIHV